jgi:hypothetical protein
MSKTTPETAATPADLTASLHRARAREIVERHTTYAALGCVLPLPLVELATLGAVVFEMCRSLAAHYQVPLSAIRIRAIVIPLVCALVPTGAGHLTAMALSKLFVPGANMLGFAAATMSAAALTRLAGLALVTQFESADAPLPITLAAWRVRLAAVAA